MTSSEYSGLSRGSGINGVELLAEASRSAVRQLLSVYPAGGGAALGLERVLSTWSSEAEFDAKMAQLQSALDSQEVFAGLSDDDVKECVNAVVPLVAWSVDAVPLLRHLATEVKDGNDSNFRSWDNREAVTATLRQVAAAWEWALSGR